ncbi:hypothetical protein ACFYUR_18715 [Micromonospora haikouensis]|uniref:hypothetical protein n=1 Tax=Micromonospora haikouensis TaxID=686309 RepID=UPI0036A06173
MTRYVVVRGLYAADAGAAVGDTSNYLVVDLTGGMVMADCGDSAGRAQKVAQALNALDGGLL